MEEPSRGCRAVDLRLKRNFRKESSPPAFQTGRGRQMKPSTRVLLLLTLAFGLVPGAGARADQAEPEKPPEVGIAERLGETIPLDAEFYDESGNLVTLKSLITKPTILTFVYFQCPGICTPLLTELSHMVEKMDLEPGKEYQIITISFDHRDTPELAADKKENYLSAIARPVGPESWRFLTGDSLTIRRVTSGAGFYYKRAGNDWIHAGTLIFLSSEGKVTRYIYGIKYLAFDVKMAIYEASSGRVGPTIANILTFCYSYDPEGRRYTFNFLQVSLVVILVLVGIFVLVFIVIPRKKSREREAIHGKSS
jgi:protein SCO1/2